MKIDSDRTKYGNLKYMLKYGTLSNKNMNMIYVSKSSICEGYGVFAKRDIPQGKMITWYYGYKKLQKYTPSKNKYVIEFNEKYNLIGIQNICRLYSKGVGQLINDAIFSKKKNNAYFFDKDNYIVIISNKDIKTNDEILIGYGIDYWKNQINYNIQNGKITNINLKLFQIEENVITITIIMMIIISIFI